MKAKELIGMDISTARSRLGYWWLVDGQHLHGNYGFYTFFRCGVGRVELRTELNKVTDAFPPELDIDRQ